ncbi:MAG: hypothetical protein JRI91_17245 [Deltaproteobacteria bacterium]|nr:hypothetical protein [Deltaproteobacteria bacterium]
MMIMGQAGLLIFGPSARSLPATYTGVITFGGINLAVPKLMIVIIGLSIIFLLYIFLNKTKTGRAMRAVSFLPETAALQGTKKR